MALQEELEVQGNFLFRYRSFLPLVLLGMSIISFVYFYLNTVEYFSIIDYRYLEIIGLSLSFFGLLTRVFTVGYSAKNTSGRNTKSGQIADELNTTGIYSIVRHPLYVGNFFMWLGPAVLVQNFWFLVTFIFIYWVYYERIMFAEEQFLRKKFSDEYLSWAKKVPAFVFSFKNYIRPKESFSWKKVLKKEKNGFTAIFVTFFLFSLIRSYLNQSYAFTDTWLFYATIGSIILYYILKVIKRYTTIFEDGR